MNFRRILISVDPRRRVLISLDGTLVGTSRLIEVSATGPNCLLPPEVERPELLTMGIDLDPLQLHEIQDRLRRRESQPKDPIRYGKYLFHTLIGLSNWAALREAVRGSPRVEIALRFDLSTDAGLRWSSDYWELIHSGEQFLASGFTHDGRFVKVAITRVVDSILAPPQPMSLPPRVLFVVGCSLDDDRIAPGAEFLALLRSSKHPGSTRTLHPRLLVNASVEQIRLALNEFRPDVLHIVAHGTEDGRLEFTAEPDLGHPHTLGSQPSAVYLDAQQIEALMHSSDWRPTVILLSACHTAGDGSAVCRDGSMVAPIAVRLVQQVAPIVIGMSGNVADTTCRIFSRSFGQALCAGHPLVASLEAARRAEFVHGSPPDHDADWARPTFFCASSVDTNFTATAKALDGHEHEVMQILEYFRGPITDEPVFAAWQAEFERVYRNLRNGTKSFLVIRGENGAGRSRLLQELVASSARDGDIPVLISAHYRGREPARDVTQLLKLFIGAVGNTASFYGAHGITNTSGQLEMLVDYDPADLNPNLAPDVRLALGHNRQLTIRPMVLALRHDLVRLKTEITADQSAPVNAAPRVIVVWDELEALPRDVLDDFFCGAYALFGPAGIADPAGDPIPLIVSFEQVGTAQETCEGYFARLRHGWAEDLHLVPVQLETRKDFVPYQHVLLHPKSLTLMPPYSDRGWVFKKTATDDSIRGAIRRYSRMKPRRLPCDFVSDKLFSWVAYESEEMGTLVSANDEDLLRDLHRR